jgi:multidrug transporter EmrE-like cation transporter
MLLCYTIAHCFSQTALYTNAWLLVLELPFIQSESNLSAYFYLVEHPEAALLCIVMGCLGYIFFYFALILTSLASATTTEVVRSLGFVGAMCLRFVFLGKMVTWLHFGGAFLLVCCAFMIQRDIFCDEGLQSRLSQLYSHYTAMEDESAELSKELSIVDATLEETQSFMLALGTSGTPVKRILSGDDIDDDADVNMPLSPGGRPRRRSISAI